MMKHFLIIALLAVLPSSAFSQEFYFLLGSYHTKRSDHCEFNPGVIYENDKRYLVGAYSNSNCDLVVVGGRNMYRSKDIHFGSVTSRITVPAGVAFGYPKIPLLPFIMPIYEVDINENFSIGMSVIPVKDPVFGIGIKYRPSR